MCGLDGHFEEISGALAADDAKRFFAMMFPDVAYEEKYVLWLNFGLYWRPFFDAIDCRIRVCLEDGEYFDITNLRTRTLYPDKNLHIACMKNKRKVSDSGVMLYFDRFEELNAVKQIQVYWTVYGAFWDSKSPYHIFVNYHLSFESAANKKNYFLISHDIPFAMQGSLREEYDASMDVDNPQDKYDNVFILKSQRDEYSFYSVQNLKGRVSNGAAFDAWWGLSDAFKMEFLMECFSTARRLTAKAVDDYL